MADLLDANVLNLNLQLNYPIKAVITFEKKFKKSRIPENAITVQTFAFSKFYLMVHKLNKTRFQLKLPVDSQKPPKNLSKWP